MATRIVRWTSAAAALLVVVAAWQPLAGAAPPVAGCFPPCRSGFVCSPTQQCVSACNPACPQGQECTADAQCVQAAQPQPSFGAPAVPPTTAYPSTGVYSGAPPATSPSTAYASPAAYLAAPIEDAKERRRLAPPALSLFAAVGYGSSKNGYVYGSNGSAIGSLKHEGATFTGGVVVRKYLTRIMGFQARATLLLGEGKGTVVATPVDATLRLGPFGRGFPWFFGVGPYLGSAYFTRTVADYSPTTTGTTSASGSSFSLIGGGVAETGFLFGNRDRIEIVARSYVGVGSLTDFGGEMYEFVLGVGFRL